MWPTSDCPLLEATAHYEDLYNRYRILRGTCMWQYAVILLLADQLVLMEELHSSPH